MNLEVRHHTSGFVPGAGLYEMTAEQYHLDPAPSPSLSASIACTLLFETPLHAWHNHPRLRPGWAPEETSSAVNRGSVAHELILGKGGGYDVLEFDDWRTKAAKEARDASISAGRTPILAKHIADASELVQAVRDAVRREPDCADFFDPDARSELVMIWQDIDGVWCRAMLDRLTPRGIVYDIKTSGRGLDDRTLGNRFASGFAVQPAFYLRGLHALFPDMAGRFRWRWIHAEQDAPYATRIDEAGNITLGHGLDQAETALRIWRDCLRSKSWPGYRSGVGRLDPPDFVINRWAERQDLPSLNAPLQAAQ